MRSNNEQPLISIIVPVYKVEQYLDRCVESIINQTYKNLEIILVDDGSPDNCPAMCDEWACKDARIKVVHKQNGGLSDARNAGMDIAKGEYIAFVDSDDYVRSDMYELLYNNMQENESDISACGVEMVREDETSIATLTTLGSYVLNNEEAMIAIIKEDVLKQPVWYKLYKSKCIQNNYFPVGKYHEDIFWSYLAIAKAKKVSVFDAPCYYYTQRGESIMGQNYSSARLDALEAAEIRCAFLSDNYPELVAIAKARFIGMCMYHSQKLLQYKIEGYKNYFKDLHIRSKKIGDDWSKGLSKKQRLWIGLYLACPKFICAIRNLLKIGI